MKREFSGACAVLVALALCLLTLSSIGLAQADDTITLSAIVNESGVPVQGAEYVIRLSAQADDCPMPAGSANGVFDLTVKGGVKSDFPDITFKHLGDYKYTISQLAGNDALCVYDTKVYTALVQVRNAQVGSGFEIVAVLYAASQSDKYEMAEFDDIHFPPTPGEAPTPTPINTELPTATPSQTNNPGPGLETEKPSPTPTAVAPTTTPSQTNNPGPGLETEKPTAQPESTPSSGNIPKTGDSFDQTMLLGVAGVCGLMIIALACALFRRRKQE